MDKVRPTATGILGDALVAAGHHLPMPCRGRHTCGKCGVHVAGEVAPPDAQEAELLRRARHLHLPGYSYRLACLAQFTGEASVIASSISGVVVADVDLDLPAYDGPSPQTLGCAIDIGTTTVTVLLFRLHDHELLADASRLNHQAVHGSDVISRIDAASRVGVTTLQALIVDQLTGMLQEVLERAGEPASAITRMCITGNTTMLHLLTRRPVAPLGVHPFTPQTRFGSTIRAADLFPFLGDVEIYLPPAISTFVGPDIVCGLLATGLGAQGRPELLVDVGTNGEMALAAQGSLWCCSTAAGPAFEGAEISSGMPALPGAIDDVWAEADGVHYSTIGRKRPKGICGTGLISAVDTLLGLEGIDPTGTMAGSSIAVGDSQVTITQDDVRRLQLAKAAIAAGIDTLLSEAALAPDDVDVLHLAGGFGSYLQPRSAAGIGLIPWPLVDKANPAGNSALTGAALLVLSKASRRTAEEWAGRAIEVSLANHPVWMDRFIENMAFLDPPDPAARHSPLHVAAP